MGNPTLPISVLYYTPECAPFSQAGGVGIVSGQLPKFLAPHRRTAIVTPCFDSIPRGLALEPFRTYGIPRGPRREIAEVLLGRLEEVPVLFVRNATHFEGAFGSPYVHSTIPYADDTRRFAFLAEVGARLVRDLDPDLVHVHDWTGGYLLGLLELEGLTRPARVLTIHNLAYQGNIGAASVPDPTVERLCADQRLFPLFQDPREDWASVNPMRLAMELADMVVAVSPRYCREILETENRTAFFSGASGLEAITRRLQEEGRLVGILNGHHP